MTIDELLNSCRLKPLPLRAWLSPGERAGASWFLKDEWAGTGQQPFLCGATLKLLDLGQDLQCVAVIGHAVEAGSCRSLRAENLRAFVYLLNPADPCVRETIESWVRCVGITVLSGHRMLIAPPDKDDATVLEACQSYEGDEIISDFVTSKLVELWHQGRLEEVVEAELCIDRMLFCAIVETPMLCASLRPPLTQEEVASHEAHQANKFELEGIAS